VANLRVFVHGDGYDGVDIDWEYPSTASDRKASSRRHVMWSLDVDHDGHSQDLLEAMYHASLKQPQ
jgi:GH18 family chitinase